MRGGQRFFALCMRMRTNFKKMLLVCVALMAAMALLLCGCNNNSGKNDKDDKDDKNVTQVEDSADLLDRTTSLYGDVLSIYKEALSGDMGAYTASEMRLVLGDEAKDLIEDLLKDGGLSDTKPWLDILDGLTIGLEGGMQDGLMQMLLSVGCDDTTVLDLDCIFDFDNGDAYIGIPSLVDGYLVTSQEPVDMSGTMDELSAVLEIMPSEELLSKLLDKYLDIALDECDNVSEKTKTVKVSGVEEEMTVREIQIDEENAIRICLAVLKELKKDADVEDWLKDAESALDLEGEVYDSFCDALEEYIDTLSEVEEYEEGYIDLVLYLNDDEAMTGLELSFVENGDSQEFVRYLTAIDGKNFGFELNVADRVEVTGKGSEKNGAITATYDVAVEGEDVLTLAITDYDGVSGTFRITPDEDLMDSLDLPAFITMLEPSLQLEMDGDKGECGIYVMTEDEVFAGLVVTAEVVDKNIKLPSSKDVYAEDEVEEWLSGMDYDDLLKALRKIGVPEDVVGALEEALEQLESGEYPFGGDDYYDNDYDEYYNGYYDGNFDYDDYFDTDFV